MVKIDSKDIEIDAIVINDRDAQPSNVKPGYTQLYTTISGVYTLASGSSPVGPLGIGGGGGADILEIQVFS
jgi:hypothetical protein